jgi:RHS repeat-associated protein
MPLWRPKPWRSSTACGTHSPSAEGNVVEKSKAGDVWSYSYDLENRLIAARHATTPTAAPVVTVTYGVDASGNPVSRVSYDTNGGVVSTRYYGLDGWDTAKPTPAGTETFDVWVQFDSPDHPYYVREWLYGPGFNDPVATFNSDGSQYYWYQADRLGSIRVRTDMYGTPLATLTYDAFGQLVSGTLTDPFGFQGMFYDADSQTYQDRARMYDPAIGRFYSQDPLRFAAGDVNLYRYVGNSPTNATDPSGLVGGDNVGEPFFCLRVRPPRQLTEQPRTITQVNVASFPPCFLVFIEFGSVTSGSESRPAFVTKPTGFDRTPKATV